MSIKEYNMNIGIKWDSYTSQAEESSIKTMAEVISEQNVAAHVARDNVHSTVNEWVDSHGKDAIRDGRITKSEYIRMCQRLSRVIVDTCMDVIPAPE